jgi:hypothetical protein
MRPLWAALLCLVLAGCQARKSQSLHIDPELETLVPADTVFVVGANVDAIRDTPVFQKLLGRMPLPQLDEFAQRTGLDPRKDLSQLLTCSNGKTGLLLARGKFKTQELEARLAANGAKPFVYKKYNLFGDERAAFFVWNPSTVIAGPAADLRSIIDQSGARGLPPAIRDLLRSLPANDQIYAALAGGLEGLNLAIPQDSNLGNITNVLRSMDSATLGMDLRSGIAVTAEVTSKTERDAKFVHDMVKGMVGFGRLNTPDNRPEMLKLYDAINVEQQQTHTKVTADISADLADRFLDLWLKH